MRKDLIKLAEIYIRSLLEGNSVMYHYREILNGDNTIDGVLTVHVDGEEELMIRANIAR